MASDNKSLLSINSSAGMSSALEVRLERIYTTYTCKKRNMMHRILEKLDPLIVTAYQKL